MPKITAAPQKQVDSAPAIEPEAIEKPAIDQDSLSIEQLAQGVLDRDFRPRTAAIRRLAQSVLTAAKPSTKSKKKRAKTSDKSGGKTKSRNKKRKLAKIPGQKTSG